MDNEQAQAFLREFAETEPTFGSEFDGSTCCLYCEYDSRGATRLASHEASCLWRRVCEALGIVPEEPHPEQPATPPRTITGFMPEIWKNAVRRALSTDDK